MSQSYPAPTTGLGVAAKIVSAGNVNTVAGKGSVPGYNDVVLSLSGANGPTTFQLNPQIQDASGAEIDPGTALTLTAVAASSGPGIITLTSVAASSGGSAVYEGTTSGGGSNAWAGYSFVVAGFENAPNNGTFVCTVVDDTHITLNGTTGTGTATSPGAIMQILPITSATIVGTNQVTIVLGASAKTQLTIGYADTPDAAGQIQGVANGGRSGNLRDHDPYVGASCAANHNWCLEFYWAIA